MAQERSQEQLDIEEDGMSFAVVSEGRGSLRKVYRTPLDEVRDAVIKARLADYCTGEIIQTVTRACDEQPEFVYNGVPHFNPRL